MVTHWRWMQRWPGVASPCPGARAARVHDVRTCASVRAVQRPRDCRASVTGLGYPRARWTCSRRAPRSARSGSRSPSECGHVASTSWSASTTWWAGTHPVEPRPRARHPVADPVGPARERQDHARAPARRNAQGRADRAVGGRGRRQGRPRGGRQGRRAPRPVRRAHAAVRRRDPPVLEDPAGRAAAARRGRHGHADRRDHREPELRRGRRAAVALPRGAARAAVRRRARRARRARDRRSRARARRARRDARRRGHRAARRGRGRRRAPAVLGARGRGRSRAARRGRRAGSGDHGRARRRGRAGPKRCSTTRPATSTTAWSRRSSRACAAPTPTPRCTG